MIPVGALLQRNTHVPGSILEVDSEVGTSTQVSLLLTGSYQQFKLLSRKYITHQFAYFIYYTSQDKLKYSRIMKIQQVLEKISS